ncbi:MAG: MFS transporter [Flavobacteriaceae bacterium]
MVNFKNLQYYKFSAYGFLKNLLFFDAFLMVYLLQTGLSYTQIGVLYASREIATNIMEIPSGMLADAYGRKTSLLISFSLFIGSFIGLYLGNSFYIMWGAMIVYGIADAFRSGSNKGMIVDYLNHKGWSEYKTEYYGGTRSWSQVGSAISSLVAGGLILLTKDLKLIFIVSIIPYALNIINVASYPNYLNFSSTDKIKKSKTLIKTLRDFWTAIRQPAAVSTMFSSASVTAYLKSIKDYIQPIIMTLVIALPFMSNYKDEQRGAAMIGAVYFIIYLLSALSSKNAYKFKPKHISRFAKITMLLAFSLGLLCGLFFEFSLGWLILILFAGIFMIENTRKPLLTSLISEEVPTHVLSSVLSAQSSYKTMITATISLFMGYVADHYSIGIALISCSFILILIALILGIKKTPH